MARDVCIACIQATRRRRAWQLLLFPLRISHLCNFFLDAGFSCPKRYSPVDIVPRRHTPLFFFVIGEQGKRVWQGQGFWPWVGTRQFRIRGLKPQSLFCVPEKSPSSTQAAVCSSCNWRATKLFVSEEPPRTLVNLVAPAFPRFSTGNHHFPSFPNSFFENSPECLLGCSLGCIF